MLVITYCIDLSILFQLVVFLQLKTVHVKSCVVSLAFLLAVTLILVVDLTIFDAVFLFVSD